MDTLFALLSQLVKDTYFGNILVTEKLDPYDKYDPMCRDLYFGTVNKVPTKYFNWYIYDVGYSLASSCIRVDITEVKYDI